MQEWQIGFAIIRRNPPAKSTASFTIGDKPLGSIDVDHHLCDSPDIIFATLMKYPHRWAPRLPAGIRPALLTYRKETIHDQRIADVDPRDKTYRFLQVVPHRDSLWKLTTDKSDIRRPTGGKHAA
jgi:hypothetical protein